MSPQVQFDINELRKSTEDLLKNTSMENIAILLKTNFNMIFEILAQQQALIAQLIADKKKDPELELNIHPELQSIQEPAAGIAKNNNGGDKNTITCHDCGLSFKKFTRGTGGFSYHVVEKGCKPYKCFICEQLFKRVC